MKQFPTHIYSVPDKTNESFTQFGCQLIFDINSFFLDRSCDEVERVKRRGYVEAVPFGWICNSSTRIPVFQHILLVILDIQRDFPGQAKDFATACLQTAVLLLNEECLLFRIFLNSSNIYDLWDSHWTL